MTGHHGHQDVSPLGDRGVPRGRAARRPAVLRDATRRSGCDGGSTQLEPFEIFRPGTPPIVPRERARDRCSSCPPDLLDLKLEAIKCPREPDRRAAARLRRRRLPRVHVGRDASAWRRRRRRRWRTSAQMPRRDGRAEAVPATSRSSDEIADVGDDPNACDFLFGNPHEVAPQRLRRRRWSRGVEPTRTEPLRVHDERPDGAGDRSRPASASAFGLAFAPDDIMMTNGNFTGHRRRCCGRSATPATR